MSGILTPGYLRWDGTKYVLDHDVEIVGPPGSAGPAGPTGPVGPPGPVGTAGGDLLGSYPNPSVVGLTGISGVVNFGGGISNPTISQSTTGGTNGQPLTFKAQNAGLFGGNVILQSGTGSTAGIIQFVIGLGQAAFIDSNSSFRIGPGASSTATGPQGASPLAGVDFFYGNNPTGSTWMDLFAGTSNQRAGVGVYNYAAGGVNTNGISIQSPGSTFGFAGYQSHGVIEQTGPTSSALVLAKNQGDGSGRAITGRIWQTGAWGIGDSATNNSSVNAQAGISGPVMNFGGTFTNPSSLTSTSGQAVIFNALTPPFFNSPGILTLQASVGLNFLTGTAVVMSSNATKFITNQGRTLKVRTTTTTPVTVTTSDEIISIGTITANSTTIAVGSNNTNLPQGTINVASTTGFATSGTLLVTTTNGAQIVTYTNTAGGNQFTGCSGGTGTMATGNPVVSLFTVTLPASPTTGDTYTVKDANGSANAANILVLGNGVNIDGFSNSLIMTPYTQATYVYNGTSWISTLGNNLIPNGFSSTIQVASGGTGNVVGFDALVLCDPTSASCTVNAPTSPQVNLRFTVKDATAQATALRPIVVNGSGLKMEDPGNPGFYTGSISITTPAKSVTWAYDPLRTRYMVV
jgi:collagen type I alpha